MANLRACSLWAPCEDPLYYARGRTFVPGAGRNGGFPEIKGTILGGPRNKDYSIEGVYVGVPVLRETTDQIVRSHGFALVVLKLRVQRAWDRGA